MSEHLIPNAGDEESVKKGRKREDHIQKQKDLDLANVMSTELGRRFIWDQLSPIYRTVYRDNPHTMAAAAGEQMPALRLLAEIMRVCPDSYLLMQGEAIKKEKANA